MTKEKYREPVEVVLDYLNGMIYGGKPEYREGLRTQAVELTKKWEDEVIRDLYRQFKAQQTSVR